MKTQALNPYLPLNVCIADGEPKVFGDRVYVFGSHDRPGGNTFCEYDYEVWSAPIDELGSWQSHGSVYTASRDPGYSERKPYLFAPDVTRGNDGRYYLYYSLGGRQGKHGYEGPISVAVCDTPAGQYEYLGFVRNQDGTPFRKKITFDPGVINDDGVIRLYFGTSYFFDEQKHFPLKTLYRFIESRVFDRSFAEMRPDMTGAYTVRLADDMLTVISEPRLIVPRKTKGTAFEGHAFFEAASISKLAGRYYFTYSSRNNHELCYAVSERPDEGFVFGGTLISNGDIGYEGRKAADRVNLTGNNHGNLVEINGAYYVFYHRMTDRSTYSRQACAEKVRIGPDGHIDQVRVTGCGLNGGPLAAVGTYPAAIACVLNNGRMPHLVNGTTKKKLPYIGYNGDKAEIMEITDGTVIGYRYFRFIGGESLSLDISGDFSGVVQVTTEAMEDEPVVIPVSSGKASPAALGFSGECSLFLKFVGTGSAVLRSIGFTDTARSAQ